MASRTNASLSQDVKEKDLRDCRKRHYSVRSVSKEEEMPIEDEEMLKQVKSVNEDAR